MIASLVAEDIRAIELATSDALSPRHREEDGGWLLCFDEGTVGRARSAVPLSHTTDVAARAVDVVNVYRRQGAAPMLRVPTTPEFDVSRAALTSEGFSATQATITMVAAVRDVATACENAERVELLGVVTQEWEALFVAQGIHPAEARDRLARLRNAPACVYVSSRDEGEAKALVCACFAQAWCGVHGMRTAASARRQGHARGMLGGIAAECVRRGAKRMFLQVEASNEPARSLYRQAGFSDAWQYEYWCAA